jgi:fucose 4-O-acetylase-like acetyltransferase
MSASTEKKRLDWVDGAKGLAIVLVVYGHVTGGLEAGGSLKAGSPFMAARDWVYLFHMPAFFLLSGLFARHAIGRSWRTFIGGRVRTLVYPYILWTGIYLASQIIMARFANNPPDIGRAARFLWEPYGYGLWFLYCLFLIALLFHALLLVRLPKTILLMAALGLHLAAWFQVFSFWPIFNTAMFNFVFYALGGLYAEQIIAVVEKTGAAMAVIVGFLLLGLMTGLHLAAGGLSLPLAVAFALPGIAGLLLLAKGAGPFAGFASLLGFYSLEIYLGHPLFSVAARSALGRAGIHAPLPCIAVCVAAGVFGSLALAVICARLKFPWLFRGPRKKR